VAAEATPAQIKVLQDLHNQLEKASGNRARFFQINEEFHMRLLEIANNRWRDQMVADLRKVMKLNRHNSLLKSGRINESLAEHRAIMQALSLGDAATAIQRMKDHFANGLEAAT
jgi:DNA-binding GntR family transcriptional regulator